MTRPTSDLHLHVSTTSDPKGLRETANELDRTTKATDKTRKATDQLGDSFHDTVRETKDFNDQLRKLYVERFELAKSYQESGDREVMRDFNRANRRIAILEKLSKAVASSGAKASADIIDFGGKGIRPTNALMGGAAVALAAAMPALGAMLGGALSGTAVGAAMAGGIAAASKDESVRATARDFGDTISREFFASGDAFVTPIRNSLNTLEADFQDLELEAAFAKVAPFVETVAHGIGDLAKNVMPGFNKLLDRAGPYSEVFAEGLGDTGAALGDFMDQISGSEGSLEGLNTLFMLVNGTVVALGKTINVLADTWDVYTNIMAGVSGVMEDVPDWLQLAFFGHNGFGAANDVMEKLNKNTLEGESTFSRSGDAMADAAADARGLADALKAVNDGFSEYFNIQMSVDEADIRVREGMLELQGLLKKGNVDWTNQTEAGLRNRQMLLDQVSALNAKRDADIAAANGNTDAINKINANYDKAIAKLKTMTTNAGLSEQAFMDLAGTYTITFYLRQEVGKQVVDWSELRNAERKLAENNSGPGVNKAKGFAHGGTTPAFEPFFTHPGETMWDNKQHYVATKAQTDALMRSGASGGGGAVQLQVMGGAGDRLTELIVYIIQNYVRVNGGNGATLGIVR